MTATIHRNTRRWWQVLACALLAGIGGSVSALTSMLDMPASHLAAGESHTCAVAANATLSCWGRGSEGQLGIGSLANTGVPGTVAAMTSSALHVVAGAKHSCALSRSGGVSCWGDNSVGQLGNGSSLASSTPVAVSGLDGGVLAIASGTFHTCALLTSGSVKCWGANAAGQLGDGSTVDQSMPVTVAGLNSPVQRLALGGGHSCALTLGSTLVCWGANDAGQLGDGSTTRRSVPTAVVGSRGTVRRIATGEKHTCALFVAVGVKCWGANERGQLGDGTTRNRTAPVSVGALDVDVDDIAAGFAQSCAMLSTGSARCWGANDRGQLGDDLRVDRRVPQAVTHPGDTISQLAIGRMHLCTALASGAMTCWGSNDDGQRGNPAASDDTTPTDVVGFAHGVRRVTTGIQNTCAVVRSGSLKCWGKNGNGELGNGSTLSDWQSTPVSSLGSNIRSFATGGSHACAVQGDGSAKCWGFNGMGQLGDGSMSPRLVPVAVSGLDSGVVAITAGQLHSCALTSAGGVKCWGYNSFGQLGDNTRIQRLTPVDVVGLTSGVAAIGAGAWHTCALLDSGVVKCWGFNFNYELGNGGGDNQSTPTLVLGLPERVTSISIGDAHGCALSELQAIKCWGSNSSGRLGNGSTVDASTAGPVTGLSGTSTAAATGYSHSCSLPTNGAIECWGDNRNGAIGDGTTISRLTPVPVINLAGPMVQVHAKHNHTCGVVDGGALMCWGSNDYGALGITGRPVALSPLIVAQAQAIRFDAPLQGSPAQPIALSASASSGLAVLFESTTPDVCSISNGQLLARQPGWCGVRATQTGDAYFAPAPVQHRIISFFAPVFEITVDVGPHGQLQCPATVPHNATANCTAIADAGFRPLRISGCGQPETSADVATYTTAPLMADCEISARFGQIGCGTYAPGAACSLDVDGDDSFDATDAIMIARKLFGVETTALRNGLAAPSRCVSRQSVAELDTFFASQLQSAGRLGGIPWDIDGDDAVGALTDALIIVRTALGVNSLAAGTNPTASRKAAGALRDYLNRQCGTRIP